MARASESAKVMVWEDLDWSDAIVAIMLVQMRSMRYCRINADNCTCLYNFQSMRCKLFRCRRKVSLYSTNVSIVISMIVLLFLLHMSTVSTCCCLFPKSTEIRIKSNLVTISFEKHACYSKNRTLTWFSFFPSFCIIVFWKLKLPMCHCSVIARYREFSDVMK